MSILTKPELIQEIKKKRIKITPFNIKNIGPASIDLTLDNKFRIFSNSKKIFVASDKADYKKITKLITSKDIILNPQDTILGITKEKISLPSDICGWLEGRSRFARIGLMVHISAPFMQPGINNKQVLEISNMSHIPIKIKAGTKICQFIFQRVYGNAKYKGIFKNQTKL